MKTIDSFSGDHRYLSNFWMQKVQLKDDARFYSSVEHAYQASKVIWVPGDPESIAFREQVLSARTPGDAKILGNACALRYDWESVKEVVMLDLLCQKFRTGSKLGMQLVMTKDARLIEGNRWHDNYWGNCYCSRCKAVPGKNRLGILLMQVRDALRGGDRIRKTPTT